MRKYLFFSIICAFLLSVAGCQKDACAKVSCGDYGNCEEGECTCLLAYEKDATGKCTILQRDKFVGKWGGSVTVYRDSSGILDTTLMPVTFDIQASGRSLNEIDVVGYPVTCLDSVYIMEATVLANSISAVKSKYCSYPTGQSGVGFTNLGWYVNGGAMNIDMLVIKTDPNKPIGGVVKEHYVGNANRQ